MWIDGDDRDRVGTTKKSRVRPNSHTDNWYLIWEMRSQHLFVHLILMTEKSHFCDFHTIFDKFARKIIITIPFLICYGTGRDDIVWECYPFWRVHINFYNYIDYIAMTVVRWLLTIIGTWHGQTWWLWLRRQIQNRRLLLFISDW